MTPTNALKQLLAIASLALIIDHPSAAGGAPELIIQGVTVISPERAEVLPNASVRLRDGLIAEVATSRLNVTGNAQTIDGRGRYLIPGLMDSHLHVGVIPGFGIYGYQRSGEFPELVATYQRQLPRSLLYFGVTQLVDPATVPAAWHQQLRQSPRPDMFHCGAVMLAGGYPLRSLGKPMVAEDFPYLLVEAESNKSNLPAGIDPQQHTPEAVVQRLHADGAICVKLFFEDGWGADSSWPLPSSDSIQRVIAEARRLGLPVLAHANALDMQQMAVAAGVDVLAHGLWNWMSFRGEPGLPEGIRKHLDSIRDAKIAFQPTLRTMAGIRALFEDQTLAAPILRKIVAKSLLDWYGTDDGQWFKDELSGDFDRMPDAAVAEIVTGVMGQGERATRYLAENDHPLLLASDLPANPGYANQPGLSTYQELVHMAQAGVSLPGVFAAATTNNATAFGLADRYGTIAPGKIANLLLLSENPLQQIGAYQAIELVILHGKPIHRESLAVE